MGVGGENADEKCDNSLRHQAEIKPVPLSTVWRGVWRVWYTHSQVGLSIKNVRTSTNSRSLKPCWSGSPAKIAASHDAAISCWARRLAFTSVFHAPLGSQPTRLLSNVRFEPALRKKSRCSIKFSLVASNVACLLASANRIPSAVSGRR